MKKALVVIAPEDFRDEEYLEPKQVLEQARIMVLTASSKLGIAHGKLGATAKIDLLLADAKAEDYDAVIFVGGPGCYQYYSDPVALKLAKEAHALGKVIAGICSAAGILAHARILKGKKATIFPGEAELLKKSGAIYQAKGLEIDGKVITADGPQNATAFGEAIRSAL